jgi:hypothetical protein
MTFPIDEGKKGRLPKIQGKKKSTDRKGRWMGERAYGH